MVRRGVVAGDHKAKICLTSDLLATPRWHGSAARCTVKYSQQNARGWKWHSSCAGSETDGQAVFESPQSYTQTLTTATSKDGASHAVKVTSTMVWLRADCPAQN
jgi:hypothetical protein